MQKFYSILSIICSVSFLSATEKPNIILINIDDLGYNDLSCYGSEKVKTPHLDQMAKEGRKFTDFMNASSICTPSRSALMTGSYPKRVSMANGVIFPEDTRGLHPDEVTIADMLKGVGYMTTCIGKWHIGHDPEVLPTSQGFDYYFGIPYSNDMMRRGSELKKPARSLKAQSEQWAKHKTSHQTWDVPLFENENMVEAPVDQRTITKRFTDKAIERIQARGESPFFVYIAHSMPHLPVYVPEELWEPDFKKSYKIVVEHLDAQVGRIMAHLKEQGLDKNTYVFFTSDNGPSDFQFGSALPLKGKKFSNDEGGHRVPFIAWAPGIIPAGTEYDELLTSMDILPTLASIAGAELDSNIKIDGHDVSLLLKEDATTPTKEFLYYSRKGILTGIRQGDYKFMAPRMKSKAKSKAKVLYNLTKDVSEKVNIIKETPDLAEKLEARMIELDAELSKEIRPAWTKKLNK